MLVLSTMRLVGLLRKEGRMPYFDRFDICEAHAALENDYHKSGWLQERPSNQRRHEATAEQLFRIKFKPSPLFKGYDSLSENGKEIYRDLEHRYGFKGESIFEGGK